MKNFTLASIRYLRVFLLFSALCTGMQNAIVSTEFAIWSFLQAFVRLKGTKTVLDMETSYFAKVDEKRS